MRKLVAASWCGLHGGDRKLSVQTADERRTEKRGASRSLILEEIGEEEKKEIKGGGTLWHND